MHIYELFEGRKRKLTPMPEGPKDHIILRYGFALEPFLYSQEQAMSMAGDRDRVMSIYDALAEFGNDRYLGPDLHKLRSLVKS